MKRFEDLYQELLRAAIEERDEEYIHNLDEYDSHHLDCLLNPKKHPLVWCTQNCDCPEDDRRCIKVCPFHAIHPDETGKLQIDEDACAGCAFC
ncbi:MAG TPA: iron hydrogenase, partial [Clostridiales bacterium]|nr:iron hydrogenase [Clostridiales bacterium]